MPLVYENQITYEKTPFFPDRRVPERVFKFNPSIKLILILRDPVTRTISHFAHSFYKSHKRVDSNKYNKASKLFEDRVLDSNGIVNKSKIDFHLVGRSRYVESYKRWLKYFPKEQILVLNGENFILNPYEEIKKMEIFLNLTPFFQREHFVYDKKKGFFCLRKNLNQNRTNCMGSSKGRNHPFVSESVLLKLRNYFAPYDKELFDLLERKPFWKINK
jgi:hypothetical protein